MASPLVSVVIVNWNGAAYLQPCLEALSQQSYVHLEILIVDNASTDESCQIIEAWEPQYSRASDQHRKATPELHLFRNAHNEGFCHGNNQGIRAARGEFVLLLNADVELEPNFVEILVHAMRSDRQIGIALGKLLNGYDDSKIDSAGIAIHKSRRAFDRGQGEKDVGQYDHPEEVFGASGAACLYRKAMLEDLKYPGDEYLDELFFAYKEDVDLSWRAHLCGWRCWYQPEAQGRHYRNWGRGKRHTIPRRVRRHSLKNRYFMLIKNECWQSFLPHVWHIVGFELLSWGYILVREPYLLAAVADVVRAWPELLEKRRVLFPKAHQRQPPGSIKTWFQ